MSKGMYFVRKYVVKWVSSGEIAHIVCINGFLTLTRLSPQGRREKTSKEGKE